MSYYAGQYFKNPGPVYAGPALDAPVPGWGVLPNMAGPARLGVGQAFGQTAFDPFVVECLQRKRTPLNCPGIPGIPQVARLSLIASCRAVQKRDMLACIADNVAHKKKLADEAALKADQIAAAEEQATLAAAGQLAAEVAAAEEAARLAAEAAEEEVAGELPPDDEEEPKEGMSTTTMILIGVGGVAVIGGVYFMTR